MGNIKKQLLIWSSLYFPRRYNQTVWLFGSGRSGTTWVASLINHKENYRELFEPFHSSFKDLIKVNFRHHLYLRVGDLSGALDKRVIKIFSGKIYNPRVENLTSEILFGNKDSILVKDVFVNLMAHAVCEKYAQIKPVLLLRNPFAVALSKVDKGRWDWLNDPGEFLNQVNLCDDFLNPYKDYILEISKNGTPLEKHILIWAIINYVPLKQFGSNGRLCVSFYEDWVMNPQKELNRVSAFLGGHVNDFDATLKTESINEPSKTSSKKTFSISSWRNSINDVEYESGLRILEHFGLKNIYNFDSTPNSSELTLFLNAT
ncbi:sulfotransferase domain-containing protein [Mangrovimonas futianensis]|uniref:sulfotransferase domain-containing protein n=1 Tax=Mangrovimonas futianensis TaxID=2895523 RepID=UPI001E4E29AF|nr:sulfotransferase domain-containing protein [Mangrovimonas futianensis]MCF1420251.1 sulfotransferase domain-containing protein [Mangrovimonas futianensis]